MHVWVETSDGIGSNACVRPVLHPRRLHPRRRALHCNSCTYYTISNYEHVHQNGARIPPIQPPNSRSFTGPLLQRGLALSVRTQVHMEVHLCRRAIAPLASKGLTPTGRDLDLATVFEPCRGLYPQSTTLFLLRRRRTPSPGRRTPAPPSARLRRPPRSPHPPSRADSTYGGCGGVRRDGGFGPKVLFCMCGGGSKHAPDVARLPQTQRCKCKSVVGCSAVWKHVVLSRQGWRREAVRTRDRALDPLLAVYKIDEYSCVQHPPRNASWPKASPALPETFLQSSSSGLT